MSCSTCNTTANFLPSPDANGICQCREYFEIQGNTCVEICGDGVIFTSEKTVCDDGNLRDLDGCSSNCTVEKLYSCASDNIQTPSQCIYVGLPLNLSLSYIERVGDENRGNFVFMFTP